MAVANHHYAMSPSHLAPVLLILQLILLIGMLAHIAMWPRWSYQRIYPPVYLRLVLTAIHSPQVFSCEKFLRLRGP